MRIPPRDNTETVSVHFFGARNDQRTLRTFVYER
jgi:hypothetical protein